MEIGSPWIMPTNQTASAKTSRRQYVACDACRMRKVKCDARERGQTARCGSCVRMDLNCTFHFVSTTTRTKKRDGKRLAAARNVVGVTSHAPTPASHSSDSTEGSSPEYGALTILPTQNTYSQTGQATYSQIEQFDDSHREQFIYGIFGKSRPDSIFSKNLKFAPIILPTHSLSSTSQSIHRTAIWMELQDHLLTLFLRLQYVNTNVVDDEIFLKQYLHHDPHPPPDYLIASLVASASVYSEHPALKDSNGETVSARKALAAHAQQLLIREMWQPSPEIIQACIIVAPMLEDLNKTDGVSDTFFWETAIRHSISLRYNLAATFNSMSPMEKRERLRLWWTCYVLDSGIATGSGRPLIIGPNDHDHILPDLDNNASSALRFSNSDVVTVFQAERRKALNLTWLLPAHIRQATIARRYCCELATIRQGKMPHAMDTVKELHELLVQWEDNFARFFPLGRHTTLNKPMQGIMMIYNMRLALLWYTFRLHTWVINRYTDCATGQLLTAVANADNVTMHHVVISRRIAFLAAAFTIRVSSHLRRRGLLRIDVSYRIWFTILCGHYVLEQTVIAGLDLCDQDFFQHRWFTPGLQPNACFVVSTAALIQEAIACLDQLGLTWRKSIFVRDDLKARAKSLGWPTGPPLLPLDDDLVPDPMVPPYDSVVEDDNAGFSIPRTFSTVDPMPDNNFSYIPLDLSQQVNEFQQPDIHQLFLDINNGSMSTDQMMNLMFDM